MISNSNSIYLHFLAPITFGKLIKLKSIASNIVPRSRYSFIFRSDICELEKNDVSYKKRENIVTKRRFFQITINIPTIRRVLTLRYCTLGSPTISLLLMGP